MILLFHHGKSAVKTSCGPAPYGESVVSLSVFASGAGAESLSIRLVSGEREGGLRVTPRVPSTDAGQIFTIQLAAAFYDTK